MINIDEHMQLAKKIGRTTDERAFFTGVVGELAALSARVEALTEKPKIPTVTTPKKTVKKGGSQ